MVNLTHMNLWLSTDVFNIIPIFTSLECGAGSYGYNCSETCSSTTCATGTLCDRVNGHCLDGCKPGYTGNFCETSVWLLFTCTVIKIIWPTINCSKNN